MKGLRFFCAALLWAAPAAAGDAFFRMTEKEIARDLRRIHARRPALRDRLAEVSGRFLGTPYRWGPLGEGPSGEFDRDPLIRFDAADCTTFVEEVLALSLEPDLEKAKALLQRIRYEGGRIAYETRNHFTALDWVPNNEAAGFLMDITREAAGEKARVATKRISKREWYLSRSTADLEGFGDAPEEEHAERVRRWRELGAAFEDRTAALPYLPIESLPELLDRIPSGTVANLVREDLPGMPVLVSHQVLIVEKRGAKVVRHAAFGKAVEDVPALEYFYRYFGSKWRLLGLNLNAVQAPGSEEGR